MKKLFFLMIMLGLTACVSAPSGLQQDEFTLTRLSQIEPAHFDCQCKTARLGGRVLSVTALEKQMKLEILSLPIASYSARPIIDGFSEGRFIAYIDGFIDPKNLQDQYVTVKGTLQGTESGKIDQATYYYPILKATAYKRWQQVEEVYYDYYDDDGWGRPAWGFWHSGWGFPYYQLKTRIVLY